MRVAIQTSTGTIYQMRQQYSRSGVTTNIRLIVELCKEPYREWTTPEIADLGDIDPKHVRHGLRYSVRVGLLRIVKKGKAGRPKGDSVPMDTNVYGAGPELLRMLEAEQ